MAVLLEKGDREMIAAAIVHMGQKYPSYLSDCIEQFFLVNRDIKLYCLVESDFSELEDMKKKYGNLEIIRSDKIKKSFQHSFFLAFNRVSRSTWRNGFWRYVIERFFTLYDFMKECKIEKLLHFEYDNLIYGDIAKLENSFVKQNRIGLISDSDDRCIPGVVFVPNAESLKDFCSFYNFHYTLFPNNDMVAFSKYINVKTSKSYYLPVVPPEYVSSRKTLSSLNGKVSEHPDNFCINYESFGYIFDAASFGQYIGGTDSQNGESKIHFINEQAVYSPEDFNIVWKNENGLKSPYVIFNDVEYKMFNLHIHCKKLNLYRSDKVNL